MSPSQSPVTSLLAWLTVSVFLLAGAPAQRAQANNQGRQQRETPANAVAKSLVSLDLARSLGTTPVTFFKTLDLLGTSSAGLPRLQLFSRPGPLRARCSAQNSLRRPRLVGIMELRI